MVSPYVHCGNKSNEGEIYEKYGTLIIIATIIYTIIIGINAFDECNHWHLLKSSGNYRYTQAGISYGPYSYEHDHQVTAELWRNLWNPELVAFKSSLMGPGPYYPETTLHHTTDGPYFPEHSTVCPLIND